MKSHKIWANFTVKDIKRTAEFYTKIGFEPNTQHGEAEVASFLFSGDEFVINFFKEGLQPGMDGIVSNLKTGNEIMFTLAAKDEEEVKKWEKAAKDAGGTIFKQSGMDKDGYYYCGFSDPDGHKFNVLMMQKGM